MASQVAKNEISLRSLRRNDSRRAGLEKWPDTLAKISASGSSQWSFALWICRMNFSFPSKPLSGGKTEEAPFRLGTDCASWFGCFSLEGNLLSHEFGPKMFESFGSWFSIANDSIVTSRCASLPLRQAEKENQLTWRVTQSETQVVG